MRRLLEFVEGALDALPVGADRDHLCAAIRAESDSLDEWSGIPLGTPGTCDGSLLGVLLGQQEGANLNELCGCSCPHVLNICAEGVRRTSSLPGLVGVQLTGVEMASGSGSASACELLLWADRDSHPVFTSTPRQRGITVTLHDGDSAAAPITDGGVASGSRMVVKLEIVAELVDAGMLQLGSWSAAPGSCTNGARDLGEELPDCGGPCPRCRPGCTAAQADNFDARANVDDGSCRFGRSSSAPCTDPLASNYYARGSSGLATGPEYRGACEYDCETLGGLLADLRNLASEWARRVYEGDGWSAEEFDGFVQGTSPSVCAEAAGFESMLAGHDDDPPDD